MARATLDRPEPRATRSASSARLPSADDLYALRVPVDVRISPDTESIVYCLKESSVGRDDYRQSLWLVPADGSGEPRQLTLGRRKDTSPRFSPDGRTLAFISDRGAVLEAGGAPDRPPLRPDAWERDDKATERSGQNQVWLLPLDGGEARQLTYLPEDVSDLAWSPDGRRLCLVSAATDPERKPPRRRPEDPPERDARIIDRLQYMLNGTGFIHDKAPNLWLVNAQDGAATRLTSGDNRDEQPAWSPDGKRICFVSDRHADRDLTWRTDIYLVDVDGGDVTRVSNGRGDRVFFLPAWSADGRWIAAAGHRFPAAAGSRNDVWRFRPRADQAGENLSAESDLMVAAALNSDLFGFADPRLFWDGEGRSITFAAPIDGSYELWRVTVDDRRVERLTDGRQAVTRPDAANTGHGMRIAAVTFSGHEPPDVVAIDLRAPSTRRPAPAEPRRLTDLMGEAWREVRIVRPVERWHEVDGRRIQGWFLEAPRVGGAPAPLVVEIHGGPATLYGWSLIWEWQCLVAQGMSVYGCNPRGSQGYGQDFCNANHRDWGDGPMRDVMTGVDSLIADGLVDGDRLGVTGGSYGGYLTSWMVGHTDRFKAAVTCRSVNDLTSEMLSGDIAGPLFGRYEYGKNPWEEPEIYRLHSPLTYAQQIHTPLLIQHAENDLRCPITQAEQLFTVLRSLKRTVRLMRVPHESHELTRSGAPFRRVENIERISDWFRHFLVEGRRGLPRA
ncbi:MAG: S9 family peptidase [Candidatus Limnocylindrales bacterium]